MVTPREIGRERAIDREHCAILEFESARDPEIGRLARLYDPDDLASRWRSVGISHSHGGEDPAAGFRQGSVPVMRGILVAAIDAPGISSHGGKLSSNSFAAGILSLAGNLSINSRHILAARALSPSDW